MQYTIVVNWVKYVRLVIHFYTMFTSKKIFCETLQETDRIWKIRGYCRIVPPHNIVFIQCTRIVNSLNLWDCLVILILDTLVWKFFCKMTRDGQNMRDSGSLYDSCTPNIVLIQYTNVVNWFKYVALIIHFDTTWATI